jgi:hypothetical protein
VGGGRHFCQKVERHRDSANTKANQKAAHYQPIEILRESAKAEGIE